MGRGEWNPDLDIVYHYAVWKISFPSMVPACMSKADDMLPDLNHGVTINRGDVTCETCLRMMDGLTTHQWLHWEMLREFRKYMEVAYDYPMLYGEGLPFAEELEKLRLLGPKLSRIQRSRMKYLETVLDVEEATDG